MRLSEHFTLAEFVRTSTRLPNAPSAEAVENLQRLVPLLEAVRAEFGPVSITSGFRSEAVNRAVGGTPTSAHRYGCAADFRVNAPVADVVRWVGQSGLAFDQVIDELQNGAAWVHLGIARPGHAPRRQALMCRGRVYIPLTIS